MDGINLVQLYIIRTMLLNWTNRINRDINTKFVVEFINIFLFNKCNRITILT